MSWWAAGTAAVGLVSALVSSDASRSAANKSNDATKLGVDEQARQYDRTRADFAPYRETGQRALGQLETDINTPVTSADVMADPGYQFGQDQGQKALDRKIAAMGGRVSGAALQATSRYNQGYATQQYGAAYQRRQDRLNRLAALAGIGQTSTASSAAAGTNAANNISTLYGQQGDVNAASRLSQGNIWANTGNQLAALYGRYKTQPDPWVGNQTPPNSGPQYQTG